MMGGSNENMLPLMINVVHKLKLPIVAYVIGEMVKSTESQSPSRDERTMVNVL